MASKMTVKKIKYDIGVYAEDSCVLRSVQAVIEECGDGFPMIDVRIVLCRNLATIVSLSLMQMEKFKVIILLLSGSERIAAPDGAEALGQLPAERLLIHETAREDGLGERIPYSMIRDIVLDGLVSEAEDSADGFPEGMPGCREGTNSTGNGV